VLLFLAGGPGRANAQTLTPLYSFGGADGAWPGSGLVQGRDGNFYGTTGSGGTYGNLDNKGTVFTINSAGTLTTLHSFSNGADGGGPNAGLVQGRDGDFYGTTSEGGTNGGGTVFRISSAGTLTTLYSFTGGVSGNEPETALVQGRDGNFYGTTAAGGGTYDGGTVFKISSAGTLTPLHSFTYGADGGEPFAALVQGHDGNFYGATRSGGDTNADWGTVFKISSAGTLTTLYSFTGGPDGGGPEAQLVQASDGDFYGTTRSGGTYDEGTVFKINSAGTLTTLYSFGGGGDGGVPGFGGLVHGRDGNFYGTASVGGTSTNFTSVWGTVFRISPAGTLTTLHSFTGGADGGVPDAGLVQDRDGNLYGMANSGGASNMGTVYKLELGCPDVAGSWSSLIQTCLTKTDGQHCKLGGTLTVQNIGDGTSGSSVIQYYLSSDQVVDPGSDTLLKQANVRGLKPGKLKRNRLAVKLPVGTSAAGQFVIAVISTDNSATGCSDSTETVVFGQIPWAP
jgi:uncharacterized repeat protein (TIGR03803 family)